MAGGCALVRILISVYSCAHWSYIPPIPHTHTHTKLLKRLILIFFVLHIIFFFIPYLTSFFCDPTHLQKKIFFFSKKEISIIRPLLKKTKNFHFFDEFRFFFSYIRSPNDFYINNKQLPPLYHFWTHFVQYMNILNFFFVEALKKNFFYLNKFDLDILIFSSRIFFVVVWFI